MNWKPDNYPSMSPYLICQDGDALIRFIEQAFGGVLQRRYDRDDGSVMHAEVRIDDSIIMMGCPPTPVGSSTSHIHLYVPDALTVFDQSVKAGARVVQVPMRKDEGDDLRGGVQDPSGTTWWIASQ